jgi:hypothetical protein
MHHGSTMAAIRCASAVVRKWRHCMHFRVLTWTLINWRRKILTGGAFDVSTPHDRDPSWNSSRSAAAALLLHLMQPAVFGNDIAAAAFAAFVLPLSDGFAASLPHHGRGISVIHQSMALAHVGVLQAAIRVPGFTAAVAVEQRMALAVLAAGTWSSGSGTACCGVPAVYAPAYYEVGASSRAALGHLLTGRLFTTMPRQRARP